MVHETYLKGMALLTKTFNLQLPDEETLGVWEMLLQDSDDEAFIKAIVHICRTKQRLPPNIVAAVREEIGNETDSAEEAWQKVIEAISAVGIYGTPKFEDPAIASAVQAIGWKDICNTPNREIGVTRAHFYRTYAACRNRATLMDTYQVIETNVAIKKLVEGIGRRMLGPGSTTSSRPQKMDAWSLDSTTINPMTD